MTALILALFLSFNAALGVRAQAAESIWMETSQQIYNPGDTVTVTIKANSATPIQGLSFQLSYDPACFQPETPSSLLSGLNYLSVPQTQGLVDAIFASTTPLNANGALAEIKFTTLAACHTSITLEKASLAVLDASKMAVPLQGISLGNNSASFNDNSTTGQATNQPEVKPTDQVDATPTAEVVPSPTQASPSTQVKPFNGMIVPIAIVLGLVFLACLFIILGFLYQKNKQPAVQTAVSVSRTPALFIKRGPGAGTVLPLPRFPCRIGSDRENEVCLNYPRISALHAEIFADQYGYSLVDMGSQEGTYLNGVSIQGQLTRLKAGDAIRLGGVLLVFGPV